MTPSKPCNTVGTHDESRPCLRAEARARPVPVLEAGGLHPLARKSCVVYGTLPQPGIDQWPSTLEVGTSLYGNRWTLAYDPDLPTMSSFLQLQMFKHQHCQEWFAKHER